jgi:hypothetical protein
VDPGHNALIVLRYSCEEAGGIIEDLDRDWGTTFRRPALVLPSTEPRPKVLPFRKRSQQKQDSEELKERELRKLTAPAGSGAADRGGPSRNEVGAGGATEAARRPGGVGGVEPALPFQGSKKRSEPNCAP